MGHVKYKSYHIPRVQIYLFNRNNVLQKVNMNQEEAELYSLYKNIKITLKTN